MSGCSSSNARASRRTSARGISSLSGPYRGCTMSDSPAGCGMFGTVTAVQNSAPSRPHKCWPNCSTEAHVCNSKRFTGVSSLRGVHEKAPFVVRSRDDAVAHGRFSKKGVAKRTGGSSGRRVVSWRDGTGRRRQGASYDTQKRQDAHNGGKGSGGAGRAGGCTQFVHGRSRTTIDPRIPTMPGRSTSGFQRPGRHCLHQVRSAVRCSASRMKGELHPSKNRS